MTKHEPAGKPTGGQFAPNTHAEGTVALAAPDQSYTQRLAGDWNTYADARDVMAQSAMESLAASIDREFPEGSTVLLSVDPDHPSWMRVSGVRMPNGKRANNGVFQAWKHDGDEDISPLEAAEYLPSDEGSLWWEDATQLSDEERPASMNYDEWHLDLAKVRARKALAA